MSKQCNNRWCKSMCFCYECKVYLFQWIHFLVQDVRQVRTKWTNAIIKWWILHSSSIYFRTPVQGECLCNLTWQCAFHHFCRMLIPLNHYRLLPWKITSGYCQHIRKSMQWNHHRHICFGSGPLQLSPNAWPGKIVMPYFVPFVSI